VDFIVREPNSVSAQRQLIEDPQGIEQHCRPPAISVHYFFDLARRFGQVGLEEDFMAAAKLFYASQRPRRARVRGMAKEGRANAAAIAGEVGEKSFGPGLKF
jgi:hypothetical protein